MTAIRLTNMQRQTLKFCREFFAANDQFPTNANIAAHFNTRSANAAFEHMRALELKEVLARNANGKFKRGRLWLTACIECGFFDSEGESN